MPPNRILKKFVYKSYQMRNQRGFKCIKMLLGVCIVFATIQWIQCEGSCFHENVIFNISPNKFENDQYTSLRLFKINGGLLMPNSITPIPAVKFMVSLFWCAFFLFNIYRFFYMTQIQMSFRAQWLWVLGWLSYM